MKLEIPGRQWIGEVGNSRWAGDQDEEGNSREADGLWSDNARFSEDPVH